jgi:hypothetical protein
MAQVVLFELASLQWRAEPAACRVALPAKRRGPVKRQRTAVDEELVAAHRRHSALAEQRANHDLVLATVMALLDPEDFDVDSKDVELALSSTPISPTRLSVSGVERLSRFAPSTRDLTLDDIDCEAPCLARMFAMLPRLTSLSVFNGCSNFFALLPVLRHLERIYIRAEHDQSFGKDELASFCWALNHEGRLRYLHLHLSHDFKHDSAIDAISQLVRCSHRLREIYLGALRSDAPADFSKVAQALGQHSELRRITFHNLLLSAAQIHAMLKPHILLREFVFRELGEGAASVLSAHPNLRRFTMDWGQLDEGEKLDTLHAVQGLQRLTDLTIACFTEREGHAVRDAISGKRLRTLVLLCTTSAVFGIIAYAPDGTSTFAPMVNTLRTLSLCDGDDATRALLRRMLPYTTVLPAASRRRFTRLAGN